MFLALFAFLAVGAIAQQPLPVADFARLLSATPKAQLLDVRTPPEFEKGHLPQARNLDWRDEEFKSQAAKLDKTSPVFVYCQVGGRSRSAAEWLREQGFRTVYELRGGYVAWAGAGNAAVR
ncbi:MAG: rhodanese-like domain-containing protein [Sphingobacteriaceae bacterium]|nr:rhodanese-like domain-containing protein [Cytophagaceae bacterium]